MSRSLALADDQWEASPVERIRGRVALATACLVDFAARGAYVDPYLIERAHDALGEALAIERSRHLRAPAGRR